MVKIFYVGDIKNWIRLSELREKLVKRRGRGGQLKLVGNLSPACQRALLKSLEELDSIEIETSHRLCAPIESRGMVNGSPCPGVSSDLVGLYERDPQAALAVTALREMVR